MLYFAGGASGKEATCQCRRHKTHRLDPGLGRSPGGRHSNPLQDSWSYSSQGCKEVDTTEVTWHAQQHVKLERCFEASPKSRGRILGLSLIKSDLCFGKIAETSV